MRFGFGTKLGSFKLTKSGAFKQGNKTGTPKLQRSPGIKSPERKSKHQVSQDFQRETQQGNKNGISKLQRLPGVQVADRKLKHQVSQDLLRHETKQVKAHNQLLNDLQKRNDERGALAKQLLNTGGKSSVQRVALDLPATAKGIDQGCQSLGVSSELGKGFLEGFAAKKGLNLSQNQTASAVDYIKTGNEVVSATPKVAKLALDQQPNVLKRAERYERKTAQLKDVKLADLALKKGELKSYQNGQIKSGSLQADSPEALAQMLNGTNPTNQIDKKTVELNPVKAMLSPSPLPDKLAMPIKKPLLDNGLSPQAKALKQLEARDARISQLDAKLLEQDSRALFDAVASRDKYQTHTAGDVLRGVVNKPKDAAIVVSHMGIAKATGKKDLYSPETLKKAEHDFSYSVGNELGKGNVEKMLQSQVEVVTLHDKGSATARELRDLHKQKVMETDLNMQIDADGDRFYDTYKTPKDIRKAEKRYEVEAKLQLPRPEDQLYLDDEITQFIPNSLGEGIRRPLRTWLDPYVDAYIRPQQSM